MEIERRKHFFISYTHTDKQWAEWVAWQLEAAGYATVLQAWDFLAGQNFVLAMDAALRQAERLLALISPDYLTSPFSSAEWAHAFRRDPRGEQRLLIPVLIRPATIEGLLRQIIYIDLTGLDEQAARTALLKKIGQSRLKPQAQPDYPGSGALQDKEPVFPGPVSQPSNSSANYERDTAMQQNPIPLPRPQPLERKIPGFGDHFLTSGEREKLIKMVVTVIRPMNEDAIINLLRDALPEGLIELINYGNGSRNTASTMIGRLEERGAALKSRQDHALGVFLHNLIETEKVDDHAAVEITSLLFAHKLIQSRDKVGNLSARFQVPSPLLTDEIMINHPFSLASLSRQLEPSDVQERLQTLYNRRRYLLDVNFLLRGADAARSVCRIDFDKRAEGTGFLVAPNLILTNYHVMMPPGYKGVLSSRAKKCEIKFGVIGESAGMLFTLNPDNCRLEHSPSEELDFMLLKLNRAPDSEKVKPLSLESSGIAEDEFVNIIQHPNGRSMEVSLRFNQVVEVNNKGIYYLADTEEGSSGAPVFDDHWRVVALHHSGGERDKNGNLTIRANVGIPIGAIRERIDVYL